MARRYTRDNRGRFASVGATARGGRLATASGKKRETQMAKIKGGAASGTIGKPKGLKPGAIKAKPAAKSAARRADRAEANIPMRGVRGRRLDAEITRNVNAQKRQERAADKARNRQAKTEVSRAKKLRDAHIGSIAKAKGLSKGQVESALKAQPASTQIKALKNWVKVNRAAVKPAGAVAKPKGLKPGSIKPKATAPAVKKPMTKAEYEAAAKKAWGPGWNAKGAKPKQTADQQLDRLTSRSRNLQNARAGLSKSEAMKAAELGKQIGRTVRVTQNENGSFAVQSASARRRGTVGKIDDAKAGRIIGRIDANRPGLRRASGSARKTANAIKTQRKAVEFALAAGARARKQGKSLSLNDSLRRAVANAAKKRRRSG